MSAQATFMFMNDTDNEVMNDNEDAADKTLRVAVEVPPEARGDQDITLTAGPEVMRALGIPPRFEIDERLLSVLTLPPPRTTPVPPPPPEAVVEDVTLRLPLSRRPSRPPPMRADDTMRGVVVAIWTVAAVLFGVLAVLVRSTS